MRTLTNPYSPDLWMIRALPGQGVDLFFGCHTPILKDPFGLVQMFTVSGQSPNKNSGDQFLVIWRMDTGNNVSRWEAGNFRENFRRCKLLTPWDSYTDLHLSDKHKYGYVSHAHTRTHTHTHAHTHTCIYIYTYTFVLSICIYTCSIVAAKKINGILISPF